MSPKHIWRSLGARVFRILYGGQFARFGRNSSIVSPLKVSGIRNICIGDDVYVAPLAWLSAEPLSSGGGCKLAIGSGSRLGHMNHIYATRSITIGSKVLTADRVYISDNLHTYEDVGLAIVEQPIKQLSDVSIGDGSWLGENVCVIGASVGRHCVIGANSVVNRDIPDFCVAVGAPARIVKRYFAKENLWRRTNPDGSFREE